MSKELKPGRELDRLIVEKVMGGVRFCGFSCPKCGSSFWGLYSDGNRHCHDQFNRNCRWSGPAEEAPPPYSTDLAHAWQVAEKLNPLRFRVDKSGCMKWVVSFVIGSEEGWHMVNEDAESVPHAICLAALKAVEQIEQVRNEE